MRNSWNKILFGAVAVLLVSGFIFWKDGKSFSKDVDSTAVENSRKEKKGKKNSEVSASVASAAYPPVNITGKWEMPEELVEISGIAWIGKDRIACVQDELGKIFIYSLAAKSVVKEIFFGEAGDYEGIAIVGSTAYVVRADGKLFEVNGFESPHPAVKQYTTHLTAKQDVEGMCYDVKGKQLLLSIKGAEAHTKTYKGIYGFNLASKTMAKEPVYRIDLTQPAFAGGGKKKNVFQPSDLDIHPQSGELYITDAATGKLAVMKPSGEIARVYGLSKSEFAQPEGITFNGEGELFISNEGARKKGNILKVELP